MKTLTVVNGKLLSPVNGFVGELGSVLIKDGHIVAIGDDVTPEGEVLDADGRYVSPGFIDIHTHCYPGASLGIDPDVLGIQRGSTTIFDAGSSGCNYFEDFKANYIDKAETKVFVLLNIAKDGLNVRHELDDPSKIDVEAAKACVRAHKEIVGLKARASASVVGNQGIAPIALAAKTAHELEVPLMVHVGNYPPALSEVIDVLDHGDIVTHSFHGKKGGILNEDGSIIDAALRGRERGVLFDVGHGVESFAFATFQKALAAGFDCDSISTDLHSENYEGPVYDIVTTLNKLIGCGERLESAISKVTSAPAFTFGLDGLGQLAPSMVGDLNIFSFEDCSETLQDSVGTSLALTKRINLYKTIYSNGKSTTVFDAIQREHEALSAEELQARINQAKSHK